MSMRQVIRSVKSNIKGDSEVQAKVREVTSNDPWGPPSHLLSEISRATYDPNSYVEIMDMLWKRINDSGKNFRHVLKGLHLLEYLLKTGHEKVIDEAKTNLHQVATLREFHYIDQDGVDQGSKIREKAKAIAALLNDPEQLVRARTTGRAVADRMGHADRHHPEGVTPVITEEEAYWRAIEESKRTAFEAEERQRRDEAEVKRAIQESLKTAPSYATSSSAPGIAPPPDQGGRRRSRSVSQSVQQRAVPESNSSGGNLLDLDSPTMAPQPPPTNSFDPFGNPMQQNPYYVPAAQQQGYYQYPQQQQQAQPMQGYQQFPPVANNPFPNVSAPSPQPFGNSSPFPPSGISAFPAQQGATGFSTTFDGGNGPKPLPYQVGNDPNSRLANVARNSSEIDPFANLARDRARGTAAATGGMPSASQNSSATFNPFANTTGNEAQKAPLVNLDNLLAPAPTVSNNPFAPASVAARPANPFSPAGTNAVNPTWSQSSPSMYGALGSVNTSNTASSGVGGTPTRFEWPHNATPQQPSLAQMAAQRQQPVSTYTSPSFPPPGTVSAGPSPADFGPPVPAAVAPLPFGPSVIQQQQQQQQQQQPFGASPWGAPATPFGQQQQVQQPFAQQPFQQHQQPFQQQQPGQIPGQSQVPGQGQPLNPNQAAYFPYNPNQYRQ